MLAVGAECSLWGGVLYSSASSGLVSFFWSRQLNGLGRRFSGGPLKGLVGDLQVTIFMEFSKNIWCPFAVFCQNCSLSRCDGRIHEAKRRPGVFREVCSSSGSHVGRYPGRPGAPGKLPEVLESRVTGGLQSSRRNYTR